WTLERQYLLPIYQHVVIDAETVEEACHIALGNHPTIAEPLWDNTKEDFDNAQPTEITMIVAGAHENPNDAGVPPLTIPDFASGSDDESSVHLTDAPTADLCVLVIDHKHGTTCALHRSHDDAKASVLEWAREWWSQELPERPMPDDADLITEYF